MWKEMQVPYLGLLIGLELVAIVFAAESPPKQTRDITRSFCTSESFDAKCNNNEIILIKNALYGRMSPGRCISDEYLHAIGCYADVTSYLEKVCSGKASCQVLVGTLDRVTQPCLKDFKAYLEVTYECAPVSYVGDCQPKENTVRLSNRTGYISLQSSHPRDWDGGSHQRTTCPWVIQAGPGQKINISALYFTRSPMEETEEGGLFTNCPINLIIKEDGRHPTKLDICMMEKREQLVFVSKKNILELSLDMTPMVLEEGRGNLLLKYQMYGCTDIIPPEGANSKRTGDTTVVSCNETQEVWYITCQRDAWIGSPGNCSAAPVQPKKSTESKPTAVSFRYGILIAVLVGIVLGTFVGGALLFVVYLFRRSKKGGERSEPEEIQYETRSRVTDSTCSYPALLCQEKQCGDNMSEYTHVWNMRAPTICSEGPYGLHGERPAHKDCHSSKASNVSKPSFERINMSQRAGDKGRVGGRDTPMYFEFDSNSRSNTQCNNVSA